MTPALEAAYAEPHRRYHTRAHIEACLSELASVPDLDDRERRLLEWAIWWHDAVYDPRRGDNEERSAEMARRDLPALGASPGEVEEVARLILLTGGHAAPEDDDRLGAVMVSIDLAVLGAEPAVYDAYAAAVRQEYAHVPEAAFRAGREAVLRRFLDARVLYPDPRFRRRLEVRARENISRELAGA